MFHCKVGEAVRLRAAYIETKVGKAGLTVTVDYTDESGNATTGQSASAGAIAGEYYYVLTPDAAGMWLLCFKTSTSTVDQQHQFAVVAVEADYTATRAGYLDAAISTRLATTGYTTPPTAADIATAVWAAGTRTLTSLSALAADIAGAVWNALKASYTGLTTMGGALNAAGAASDPLTNDLALYVGLPNSGGYALRRIGTGEIVAVSGLSPDGSILTLVQGDSYFESDGRYFDWYDATNTTWPDLTAIPAPVVEMKVITPAGVELFTATGSAEAARRVRFEFTAAQTSLLTADQHSFSIKARWAAVVGPPAVPERVFTVVRGYMPVLKEWGL